MVREASVRDHTFARGSGHLFEVSCVQRGVTQLAVVGADDEDVTCGCGATCVHTPVLEEVVLPPLRPAQVGMRALDRHGLVALAHSRGMLAFTARGW